MCVHEKKFMDDNLFLASLGRYVYMYVCIFIEGAHLNLSVWRRLQLTLVEVAPIR